MSKKEPPRSASSKDNGQKPSEEYDRMEHLMRRLLQVPKKAIRDAEEREKKARR